MSDPTEKMPFSHFDIRDSMSNYLGTKHLMAVPMTLGDYNKLRGWKIPADESPSTPGYLVEYTDGGKPNLVGFAGYVSWSPKDVFEKSYRSTNSLTFGQAVEALKVGKKVSRIGWNGKGMYLYMVQPGRYPPSTDAGQQIADRQTDGMVPYRAYIAMLTAQGDVVPWLASQSDVLDEDWIIIN